MARVLLGPPQVPGRSLASRAVWPPACLRDALPPPASVHRFHVTVAPGTKLDSGPASLHLCNDALALARDIPPAVTGQWKLSDLRRYGAVPGGFIFEGGTRCGYCKY